MGMKVVNQLLKMFDIILNHAKGHVALMTKQRAYFTCLMIVVNVIAAFPHWWSFTNSAYSVLLSKHIVVIFWRYTIKPFKILSPYFFWRFGTTFSSWIVPALKSFAFSATRMIPIWPVGPFLKVTYKQNLLTFSAFLGIIDWIDRICRLRAWRAFSFYSLSYTLAAMGSIAHLPTVSFIKLCKRQYFFASATKFYSIDFINKTNSWLRAGFTLLPFSTGYSHTITTP
jgi:hypothetical protein